VGSSPVAGDDRGGLHDAPAVPLLVPHGPEPSVGDAGRARGPSTHEDDLAGRVAELGPRDAGVTRSGLRRRTPRATLAAFESGAGDTPLRPAEPLPFRDAAQVRDMLSQFQAGVHRAQHGLDHEAPSGADDGPGEA
jgi:hypothetical protein